MGCFIGAGVQYTYLATTTASNVSCKFLVSILGLFGIGSIDGNETPLVDWEEDPPTERCKFFLELNDLLKGLEFDTQQELLKILFDWAKIRFQDEEANVMTSANLKITSESPVISIGLHTDSHMALGLHNTQQQGSEISRNRQGLEELGIKYSNVLAYPYGSYSDSTMGVARSCGLAAAFTTDPHAVNRRSNHYRLGRFLVPNISGDAFKKQLITWAEQKN